MTSAADPLQPTQAEFEAEAACPNCGGTGKRWRTLRGRDVCDECWLETAMDEQAAHYRNAASDYKTRAFSASVPARRSNGTFKQVASVRPRPTGRTGQQVRTLWSYPGGTTCEVPKLQQSTTSSAQEVGTSVPGAEMGQEKHGSPVPSVPRESRPYTRTYAPRWKINWHAKADALARPAYNSLCLLCGRIQYGVIVHECSRCRGLCVQRSDHDLGLMQRHPATLEGSGAAKRD